MAHITLPTDVPGICGPLAFRRGAAGARDMDIHDAAIITAAFFMFNRYVEGLGTRAAKEREYELIGRRLRDNGYAPARG